jgi:hypothetical protein
VRQRLPPPRRIEAAKLNAMQAFKHYKTNQEQSVRITVKGGALHATVLDWPGEYAVIETLKCLYPDEIRSIKMLGVDQNLEWKLTSDALVIKNPVNTLMFSRSRVATYTNKPGEMYSCPEKVFPPAELPCHSRRNIRTMCEPPFPDTDRQDGVAKQSPFEWTKLTFGRKSRVLGGIASAVKCAASQ